MAYPKLRLINGKLWFEFRAATLPLGVSTIILSGTHLVTHLSLHLFIQLEFFPGLALCEDRDSAISHTGLEGQPGRT